MGALLLVLGIAAGLVPGVDVASAAAGIYGYDAHVVAVRGIDIGTLSECADQDGPQLSAAGRAATHRYDDTGNLARASAASGEYRLAPRATSLADDGLALCRTNSFVSATLVLMANGTRKPIADIQIGDVVMATDFGNQVSRQRRAQSDTGRTGETDHPDSWRATPFRSVRRGRVGRWLHDVQPDPRRDSGCKMVAVAP